jgi:hypothetical protein
MSRMLVLLCLPLALPATGAMEELARRDRQQH